MFGENLPHHAIPTVLAGLLAVLLLAAAISDWRTRSISNGLNAAIALLAIPFWFALGLDPWPQMAVQLALAIGCLALFAIFFAAGAMGGGDVKLIAALALWMPFGLLLDVLMIMAILGGLLTFAMWLGQRFGNRPIGIGIPYGIAIAAAGIWGLHQQYINQFA